MFHHYSRLLVGLWALLILFGGLIAAGADDTPFQLTVTASSDRLEIQVEVAAGCYLYEEETRLTILDPEGRQLSLTQSPKAVRKHDAILETEVPVFGSGRHLWAATITPDGNYQVTVDYQGCREAAADQGAICYMPESKSFQVNRGRVTEANPTEELPTENGSINFTIIRQQEGLLGVDAFLAFLAGEKPAASPLAGHGMLWIVFFALLAGLGLNLTPCILPLIPVNLAIIGANGGNARTGLLRASVYGLGMAIAYGVVGAAVVLTGARFGTLNSSPWFNLIICLIFIFLGLAMFGMFNFDLTRFSVKLDPSRKPWGKLLIAFLLAAIAALLAGACVAPVLIAVIMLAADLYSSGKTIGILLPFLLGIGMALPWPLAGAGLGVLPKPGAWMSKIKYVFGTIIFLAAAYYGYLAWTLRPGSFDAQNETARLQAALAEGARTGKPVFVDFWASWCKNCREMEHSVFSDARVKAELEHFVVARIQTEKLSDPAVKALLAPFHFSGLPAFAIVRPAATEPATAPENSGHP